jgi:ABC-2 type transport system permease protein
MRTLTKMSLVEAKLFLREPLPAFFGLAFPAILLVVLGFAIPAFREPSPDLGGDRPIDLYLPIVLAMAIGTVAIVTLLGVLSAYRERGILRRLSVTPISPVTLLGAQLVVNAAALVAGCVLAVLAGALVLGVAMPGNVAGVLIAFVLGAVAMSAVALLIAAVARTSRSSSAIGSAVYFPMLFAAGVWTPGPLMPDVVRRVADFTPLGAASRALQDTWAGGWPQPLHLVVLVAFTAAAGAVAARTFRWE